MANRNATSETVRALAAVPYLAELDVATLEAVARAAIWRTYQAGEMVFLEGEPCAGLYVVQEGWLKSVKTSSAGREQVVRVVGPGEAFNEVGVLADASNHATVIALEPCGLWIIRREALLALLEADRHLARVITQNMARRVLHLMALVEDLSLRTVEARLARLLLEEAQEATLHRRPWATQAEMAARLGTVPDVLNRALRKLSDEGLIHVERHQIQVVDQEGLETKAMLEL
ncbi:MAG TPA: Crp/Fnr family transcriptional regulator [Anaerolineae bacterium]|nr:Crp/Fnr family transcriptional regulator [Anaerolineae bacterium]